MSNPAIDPVSGAMEWPYPARVRPRGRDRHGRAGDRRGRFGMLRGHGCGEPRSAGRDDGEGRHPDQRGHGLGLRSLGDGRDQSLLEGHTRRPGGRDDPRPSRLQQRHFSLHRGPRGLRPAPRPGALRREDPRHRRRVRGRRLPGRRDQVDVRVRLREPLQPAGVGRHLQAPPCTAGRS